MDSFFHVWDIEDERAIRFGGIVLVLFLIYEWARRRIRSLAQKSKTREQPPQSPDSFL